MQSPRRLLQSVWRARRIYCFVLPGVAFYLIFRYYPLYYLQIAFRDFRITRPLQKCAWVGFRFFKEVFSSVSFADALKNTLIINLLKLIFCFPMPILVALMLNELRSIHFKRAVQTVLYLPHFVSWVVIASIIMNFTTLYGGLFNNILTALGHDPILFLGRKDLFRPILVLSDVWKESGYGAIIYLSALTSIDPQLYDAASIDGANRLQRIWHGEAFFYIIFKNNSLQINVEILEHKLMHQRLLFFASLRQFLSIVIGNGHGLRRRIPVECRKIDIRACTNERSAHKHQRQQENE